jgi:GAF domain-containing protein
MEQDSRLAARTVEAVRGATNLDEALDALVTQLRPRFQLWSASFGSHPAGAPVVTILAAWSVAESVFVAGTEVSVTISRMVEEVLATLREGRAATLAVGTDPESLVDHLLREQGVASLIALPIHLDDRGLLLLTLGSSTKDAFLHAGKGFFTTLSVGISDAVVRLTAATNG